MIVQILVVQSASWVPSYFSKQPGIDPISLGWLPLDKEEKASCLHTDMQKIDSITRLTQ